MKKQVFQRCVRGLVALALLLLTTGQYVFAQENVSIGGETSPYFQREILDLGDGVSLEKAIINGPPTPPPGYEYERMTAALPESDPEAGIATLSVPAFNWSFGCTATTASMIAGYYDRTSYPNMYTGPTNGGVMPMNNSSWPDVIINGENRHQCPLSATRNGLDGRTTRGHVDDYWIKYLSAAQDPFIGNWTEHLYSDCTGDYMKTNQSNYANVDGSTSIYNYEDGSPLYATDMEGFGIADEDGGYGLKLFYESRGYTVVTMYNQWIYGYEGNTQGFTYAQYKAEINAGRPVMIHVKGHTMVGVGYDDSAGNLMYIHDTWDYSTHTMTWGGSYSGMQHYSVTIVSLKPGEGPISSPILPGLQLLLLKPDCVVGTWNLVYDWNCDGGIIGSATTQYHADHTFTSGTYTGTWSHTGNQFIRVYPSGTIYSGTVNAACDYMSGTMTAHSGGTGCWTSTLVSRGIAASSNTLVKQGELLDEFDDNGRKKTMDN